MYINQKDLHTFEYIKYTNEYLVGNFNFIRTTNSDDDLIFKVLRITYILALITHSIY